MRHQMETVRIRAELPVSCARILKIARYYVIVGQSACQGMKSERRKTLSAGWWRHNSADQSRDVSRLGSHCRQGVVNNSWALSGRPRLLSLVTIIAYPSGHKIRSLQMLPVKCSVRKTKRFLNYINWLNFVRKLWDITRDDSRAGMPIKFLKLHSEISHHCPTAMLFSLLCYKLQITKLIYFKSWNKWVTKTKIKSDRNPHLNQVTTLELDS